MTIYQDEQPAVDIEFTEDFTWNEPAGGDQFYACDIHLGPYNESLRFASGGHGIRDCAEFAAQWLRDLADKVDQAAREEAER